METELHSPQTSHIKALIPHVTVFGDGTLEEVIKVN